MRLEVFKAVHIHRTVSEL